MNDHSNVGDIFNGYLSIPVLWDYSPWIELRKEFVSMNVLLKKQHEEKNSTSNNNSSSFKYSQYQDFFNVSIKKFSDGEVSVKIDNDFLNINSFFGNKNLEICIIHHLYPSPNERLMELLLMIDAVKRHSNVFISVYIPYFIYSRQERLTSNSSVISAKLVCDLIGAAGADRIITLDAHTEGLCALFNKKRFINLKVDGFFIKKIRDNFKERADKEQIKEDDLIKNTIIVSPDYGSIKRSRKISDELKCDFAIIDKRRNAEDGGVTVSYILGADIKGKDCIIVDDIIASGGTLYKVAELLKNFGAKTITAYVTHAILSGNAINDLGQSSLDMLYVADSIPLYIKDTEGCEIRNINNSKICCVPIVMDIFRLYNASQLHIV